MILRISYLRTEPCNSKLTVVDDAFRKFFKLIFLLVMNPLICSCPLNCIATFSSLTFSAFANECDGFHWLGILDIRIHNKEC